MAGLGLTAKSSPWPTENTNFSMGSKSCLNDINRWRLGVLIFLIKDFGIDEKEIVVH